MEANVFVPQSHKKKKKKIKCGWKPGTLSTLNTKDLLLHMDVNKEKFLTTYTNQMFSSNQNNPTKREW
jgi:hypothetical protein